MPREASQKAEYFPHFVGGGKTIRALDRKYGNEGYAFWFKLLETLCDTDGHCLDLSNDIEMIDFAGYVHMDEAQVIEVVELLIKLGQIDGELWKSSQLIWVQGLVDNLAPLYAKRVVKPKKPQKASVSTAETTGFNANRERKPQKASISTAEMRQRKEEKSIVKDSREENSSSSIARTREEEAGNDNSFGLSVNDAREQQQKLDEILDLACELGLPTTSRDMDYANKLVADHGAEWVLAAVGDTQQRALGARSWAYVTGTLKGFSKRGGPGEPRASPREESSSSYPPDATLAQLRGELTR